MSAVVKSIKTATEHVLFDSVTDVLYRSLDLATQKPLSDRVLVISTYSKNGGFKIVVDGNISFMQRLAMIELARAQTLQDMGC